MKPADTAQRAATPNGYAYFPGVKLASS